MHYDKAIKALNLLVENCTTTEEINRVIKASMADALFYIAGELHELNLNLRAEVTNDR